MKKILILLGVILLLLAVYIGYQFRDKFDPESVKGKNVIITGASTGIGEQLAYQYARLGANIVITARREHRLKEVVDKCKQEGNKDGLYHYISLDMAKSDSTKQLIEFAEKNLGGIDILVLNHAMYFLGGWLGPENITDLHQIMDVNFYAYVTAATYAIPALKRSKGSIILMDSNGGKMPMPLGSGYVTAQHAMEGFFGSLRQEFIMSNEDISITFCILGLIGTENTMKLLKEIGLEQRILEYSTFNSPSDTALAIVKGGAQRVQRLHYPYLETKVTEILCNIIPETLAAYYSSMYE